MSPCHDRALRIVTEQTLDPCLGSVRAREQRVRTARRRPGPGLVAAPAPGRGDPARAVRRGGAPRCRARGRAAGVAVRSRRPAAVDLPRHRAAGRPRPDGRARRPDAGHARPADLRAATRGEGGRGHCVVHPAGPGDRPGGGGRGPVRADHAAHPGRHRGDPPPDAPRLRRPRLPAVRVEVRLAQRAVAAGGGAARLPLRGALPAPHGDQGPQPRHGLVLGHRCGVAGRTRGARGVAGPGQLRPGRTAGDVAVSGVGYRVAHDRRRTHHPLRERHRAGRAGRLAGAVQLSPRPLQDRGLRHRAQAGQEDRQGGREGEPSS